MTNETGSDSFIEVTSEQLSEAADELEREFNLRAKLYPKWIEAGSLSRADARDRQKRLTWAIATLKRVQAEENYNNGADGPDDI